MSLAGAGVVALLLQGVPIDPWGAHHGRGLLNFYDGNLFGNKHLNLPLHTPHVPPPDGWEVSMQLEWANTFSRQTTQAYFVDGEVLNFHPRFRYGLEEGIELGAEIPLYARGGGILDDVVDAFHDAFGLPGAGRDRFGKDKYRALLTVDGRTSTLDKGVGVGDLEAWGKIQLWDPADAWAAAAVALTMKLPTGGTDYGSDGVDVAISLSFSKEIWDFIHAYAGFAPVFYTDTREQNLKYHTFNWVTFGGLEFEVHEQVSLLLQATVQSPLMDNPPNYDDTRYSVAFGVMWSPWEDGRTFEFGFVENVANYESTADVGFHLGYRHPF